MSLNPIASIQPSAAANLTDASLNRPRAASAPQKNSAQTDAKTSSNEAQILAPAAPVLADIPQDKVELERDSESNGEIVIRYLDSSGKVVLQVPSAEVLGIARAAEQARATEQARVAEQGRAAGQDGQEEQLKSREPAGVAGAAGTGGEFDGD